MPPVEIHGYAIVSDNDRITDGNGDTPEALRHKADWIYFQGALDESFLTVLGRLGHEGNPNPKGRRRLILSSSSRGIEPRPDGWWWNPARVSWAEAIVTVLPNGGRVAVPGGRQVFDFFLDIGYDAFHLARAEGVVIPDGGAVFSRCDTGESAEAVLASGALRPGPRQILDSAAPVSLTVWRR